ncbi:MAG TPA: RimK/LysX family protein [Hyphomicrobiales bacterium]|nr:RimK/LysX family protein [Hyphomicrobiales bacterium]
MDKTAASVDTQRILGWVENILLLPERLSMKAKLDSGAKSSALHAENIERFEKDGRTMVRFTLREDHRDPHSETVVYERPLVRQVNIKLRNTPARDQRPAVRLEFCIAGERHNTLFTLTNRSGFNYPILLGREFLQHGILVDSSESFTHRARCPRS